MGFPGGTVVEKCLPVLEGTRPWVQSLGQKESVEKEMVTHSSILVWKIPWTEEPGELSPQGCKELDMTEQIGIQTQVANTDFGPWKLGVTVTET